MADTLAYNAQNPAIDLHPKPKKDIYCEHAQVLFLLLKYKQYTFFYTFIFKDYK